MSALTPREHQAAAIRRWRYRLAVRIYPWWTTDGVDAVKWRAHQKRRDLGLVYCVEVGDLDFGACCDMRWNYDSTRWDHQPGCTRCRYCNAPGPAQPPENTGPLDWMPTPEEAARLRAIIRDKQTDENAGMP